MPKSDIQQEETIEALKSDGYTDLKIINGRIFGLHRFVFTVGLMDRLEYDGYVGRWCYDNKSDALDALRDYPGEGDPKDGHWIKYKGRGGDRQNPNR